CARADAGAELTAAARDAAGAAARRSGPTTGAPRKLATSRCACHAEPGAWWLRRARDVAAARSGRALDVAAARSGRALDVAAAWSGRALDVAGSRAQHVADAGAANADAGPDRSPGEPPPRSLSAALPGAAAAGALAREPGPHRRGSARAGSSRDCQHRPRRERRLAAPVVSRARACYS